MPCAPRGGGRVLHDVRFHTEKVRSRTRGGSGLRAASRAGADAPAASRGRLQEPVNGQSESVPSGETRCVRRAPSASSLPRVPSELRTRSQISVGGLAGCVSPSGSASVSPTRKMVSRGTQGPQQAERVTLGVQPRARAPALGSSDHVQNLTVDDKLIRTLEIL